MTLLDTIAPLPVAETIRRGEGRPEEYPNEDPSVTKITNRWRPPFGLYYWHWEGGKNGYPFRSGYGTADALDIGKIAHACIEARLHGDAEPAIPSEYAEKIETALKSWQKWWDGNVLEVVATELPLHSATHSYNGTIDVVFRDREEKLAIGDWKTSKKIALYVDSLWQLAGYQQLWNENNEEQISGGFHLIKISREEAALAAYYFSHLDDALELFLLLRRAYDLDRAVAKRAK